MLVFKKIYLTLIFIVAIVLCNCSIIFYYSRLDQTLNYSVFGAPDTTSDFYLLANNNHHIDSVFYVFYSNPHSEQNDTFSKELLCLSMLSLRVRGGYHGTVILISCAQDIEDLKLLCVENLKIPIIFVTTNESIDSHSMYLQKKTCVVYVIDECNGYMNNSIKIDEYRSFIRFVKNQKRRVFEYQQLVCSAHMQQPDQCLIMVVDSDIILSHSIYNIFDFKIPRQSKHQFDIAMHDDTEVTQCSIFKNTCNWFNAGIMLFRNTHLTRQCLEEWSNIYSLSDNDITYESNEEQVALDIALTIGQEKYSKYVKAQNFEHSNDDQMIHNLFPIFPKVINPELTCSKAVSTLNSKTVVHAGDCNLKVWNLRSWFFFRQSASFVHFTRYTREQTCSQQLKRVVYKQLMLDLNNLS